MTPYFVRPGLSAADQAAQDSQLQQELKQLSERKRRKLQCDTIISCKCRLNPSIYKREASVFIDEDKYE